MYQPIQLKSKIPFSRNSLSRSLAAFIPLLCAAIASLQSVHAATITVTNTKDSGGGSLRQALADAKDGDTIDFDPKLSGGTIKLSDRLDFDKSITITGLGANKLTIDGNGTIVGGGVFDTRGSRVHQDKTITIANLTITHGPVSGIYVNGLRHLTVDSCAIRDNSRFGSGGGIYAKFNDTSGPPFVTVKNCEISGNSATERGGGIANLGGVLTVSNSTISGNSAAAGGAITNERFASPAILEIRNCTISGNVGGGLYNEGPSEHDAVVTIGNTIFKRHPSGANISNSGGMIVSAGFNLSNDGVKTYLNAVSDFVLESGAELGVDPLQNNGGPTKTHALEPGSWGVDSGDPGFTPPPDFDQRGPRFVRVANGRIDKGAFEVQVPPTGTPPPSILGNISMRAFVQTGDNVMIGGFMVQGTERKRVIIRAIGPGLTQYGVADALANPTLELYDRTGALIASNNNWATTIIGGVITVNQVHEIQASGYVPGDGRESVIIADLPAGNYTAIVRGVNNTTGVALVEVYDLSNDASSILGNISTRSFVQTGDNVMIGGFMVQGTEPKRVIVRAIGPELTQYDVPDVLADPTLELHDGTGALIASNDNWQHTIIGGIITSNQVHEIQA